MTTNNKNEQHRPLYTGAELRPLISPDSIAIAGVSSSGVGFGARALKNAKQSALPGPVWAINPGHQEIDGVPCWPSVAALPEAVDCLIVAVPAVGVPDLVEQALKLSKARSILVFSSGIGEMGEEGRAIEARLGALGREYRVPICGPNTVGLMNFRDRRALTFLPDVFFDTAPAGNLGIASQSAGLGVGLMHSRHRGARLSHCLNAGNSCDVDVLDHASYLLSQPEVDVVALVLEGLRNPRALLDIGALARETKKPVVVYKTGRGDLAGRVAQSHTGSMIGDYALYQAAFEEAGFIVVDTMEDLLETSLFLSKAPHCRTPGIGVLTTSGGCAVMAADHAEEFGVLLPPPADATVNAVKGLAPDFAAIANPADLTANMSRDWSILTSAILAFSEDPDYATIVVPVPAPDTAANSRARPEAICNAADKSAVPLCVVWLSAWLEGPGSELLDAHPNIATFRSLRRCMQALQRWVEWHRRQKQTQAVASEMPAAAIAEVKAILDVALKGKETLALVSLDEVVSRRLLSLAGVPLVRAEFVKTAQEAVAAATRVNYPVVIKAVMPELAHKSDAGGVELNLRDEKAVAAACQRIQSSLAKHCPGMPLDGFLVSTMESGGFEALVGAKRDVLFGPVVAAGVGGTAVETLKDINVGLAPLTAATAAALIDDLDCAPRLRGGRGVQAFDTATFRDAIVSVAQLLRADERIAEIDVNPLLLKKAGSGAVALDALVVCRPRP